MSLEELLLSLQKQYISALPDKITAIETQLAQSALSDLRESFHKLRGTGRTYGVPEVSDLAEVVEDVCVDSPAHTLKACHAALAVLRDIHSARSQQGVFNCAADPRLAEIRKLLPTDSLHR